MSAYQWKGVNLWACSLNECVICGCMWACLCVRVNWACSYVSALMCFCVFLCVHIFEWICKHVHDGSTFTSEWMCNHDDLCELVNVYIYFCINAWMYVWMLIICMDTTALMGVLVSLWSGSPYVYVHLFTNYIMLAKIWSVAWIRLIWLLAFFRECGWCTFLKIS